METIGATEDQPFEVPPFYPTYEEWKQRKDFTADWRLSSAFYPTYEEWKHWKCRGVG